MEENVNFLIKTICYWIFYTKIKTQQNTQSFRGSLQLIKIVVYYICVDIRFMLILSPIWISLLVSLTLRPKSVCFVFSLCTFVITFSVCFFCNCIITFGRIYFQVKIFLLASSSYLYLTDFFFNFFTKQNRRIKLIKFCMLIWKSLLVYGKASYVLSCVSKYLLFS